MSFFFFELFIFDVYYYIIYWFHFFSFTRFRHYTFSDYIIAADAATLLIDITDFLTYLWYLHDLSLIFHWLFILIISFIDISLIFTLIAVPLITFTLYFHYMLISHCHFHWWCLFTLAMLFWFHCFIYMLLMPYFALHFHLLDTHWLPLMLISWYCFVISDIAIAICYCHWYCLHITLYYCHFFFSIILFWLYYHLHILSYFIIAIFITICHKISHFSVSWYFCQPPAPVAALDRFTMLLLMFHFFHFIHIDFIYWCFSFIACCFRFSSPFRRADAARHFSCLSLCIAAASRWRLLFASLFRRCRLFSLMIISHFPPCHIIFFAFSSLIFLEPMPPRFAFAMLRFAFDDMFAPCCCYIALYPAIMFSAFSPVLIFLGRVLPEGYALYFRYFIAYWFHYHYFSYFLYFHYHCYAIFIYLIIFHCFVCFLFHLFSFHWLLIFDDIFITLDACHYFHITIDILYFHLLFIDIIVYFIIFIFIAIYMIWLPLYIIFLIITLLFTLLSHLLHLFHWFSLLAIDLYAITLLFRWHMMIMPFSLLPLRPLPLFSLIADFFGLRYDAVTA